MKTKYPPKNTDLRHVPPTLRARLDMQFQRLVNTAFSAHGVILFVCGMVFGLGVIAR
ncbi:hypothetical protein [Burkholderia sp. Bp8990]|uniref:hypothetical protein n=1 Tax=Burkholderia sp. Bp8990 TaxID=2184552 RepID=UPI00162A4C26|nr:hypothetical protein [Burkholderia sp. Bp8990]